MSSSSSILPTEKQESNTGWVWFDQKLDNEQYITHLYEMHLLLNPSQREELENEVKRQEELAVLQVEFANMEGQMQQLMEEL
ncbi:hypothetical protein Tco_0198430 [Tanacetum coccineum]